jgi:hypothetical protein
MNTIRVVRTALRAAPKYNAMRLGAVSARRGYADVASDKIQLSLALPHQVCYVAFLFLESQERGLGKRGGCGMGLKLVEVWKRRTGWTRADGRACYGGGMGSIGKTKNFGSAIRSIGCCRDELAVGKDDWATFRREEGLVRKECQHGGIGIASQRLVSLLCNFC